MHRPIAFDNLKNKCFKWYLTEVHGCETVEAGCLQNNTSSCAKDAIDAGKAHYTPSTKSQTKFEMKEQPNKEKTKAETQLKEKRRESYSVPSSFPGITCASTCLSTSSRSGRIMVPDANMSLHARAPY